MKITQAALAHSIIALLCAPATVMADITWESSGYVKNETAFFTRDGAAYGERGSHLGSGGEGHDAGQISKFENSFNLFMNADFSETLTAHADFKLIYDGAGINDNYKGYKPYSQHDYLRELYLDYTLDHTYFRLGKQQVVWGTADGIKLLDIINPTDMREFSQNTMEDSRIPIWMLKIEQSIGEEGSDLQFVVSQVKENKIPGLTAGGDAGQPFVMRGVDSISGQVNGFLNIVPALGMTAMAFDGLVTQFTQGQAGKLEAIGGATFTVQDFIDGRSPFCQGGQPAMPFGPDVDNCAKMLDYVAQTPGLGGNNNVRNLVEPVFDADHPDNTFEYMPNTSFATFDSFAGAQSKYVRDYPADTAGNLGLRFKGSLDGGLFNYSLNYFYHYNSNPSVAMHWEDRSGSPLTSYVTEAGSMAGNTVRTVRLRKADGSDFISADPLGNRNDGEAVLVFEETLHRAHSIGASFDASLDSETWGPVVLRGEFLYDNDTYNPIVDRDALAIGDITNGLRPQPNDCIKYVLGADITLLTNLMISAQLIQFWNLDYIDEAGSNGHNSGRYTANAAALHLSNDLLKAQQQKSFVSLYFSKPFGEAQRGRFNNMTIFEDVGAYWNRFDLEYSFTDTLIGSAEWNHYWGNLNSVFGQMRPASNVQIGLKYLFD